MSFINVIIKAIIRMLFGEKKASPVDVAKFFDSCADLPAFAEKLKAMGFTWQSDGKNFNPRFDTEEPPELIISRRWANCNGYCGLYIAFLKHKAKPFEATQYYMFKPALILTKWHWVYVIAQGGRMYLQSNMNLFLVASLDEAMAHPDCAYPRREISKVVNN